MSLIQTLNIWTLHLKRKWSQYILYCICVWLSYYWWCIFVAIGILLCCLFCDTESGGEAAADPSVEAEAKQEEEEGKAEEPPKEEAGDEPAQELEAAAAPANDDAPKEEDSGEKKEDGEVQLADESNEEGENRSGWNLDGYRRRGVGRFCKDLGG